MAAAASSSLPLQPFIPNEQQTQLGECVDLLLDHFGPQGGDIYNWKPWGERSNRAQLSRIFAQCAQEMNQGTRLTTSLYADSKTDRYILRKWNNVVVSYKEVIKSLLNQDPSDLLDQKIYRASGLVFGFYLLLHAQTFEEDPRKAIAKWDDVEVPILSEESAEMEQELDPPSEPAGGGGGGAASSSQPKEGNCVKANMSEEGELALALQRSMEENNLEAPSQSTSPPGPKGNRSKRPVDE